MSGAGQAGGIAASDPSPSMAEEHAERMRVAAGKAPVSKPSPGRPEVAQPPATAASRAGQSAGGQGSTAAQQRTTRGFGRSSSSQRPSLFPYRLSTWGAYHMARFAASSAVKGGHQASQAVGNAADAITHPVETAGRFGAAAGTAAGAVANAGSSIGRAGRSVSQAISHPADTGATIRSSVQNTGAAVASAARRASTTARDAVTRVSSEFSSSYEKKRDEQR